MNTVKSLCFNNVFRVDKGLFAYQDFDTKFDKGYWCWGNTSSELKKTSFNFLGTCVFISLISLMRSAPYLMYYIYSNHQNDNWENITRMVDERISQPGVKLQSSPTLAGDYLAMELLKTSRFNSSQNRGITKLFRRNYLEYFSWLVGYESMNQRKAGFFSRLLKPMYSCTNCWCFTFAMNRKEINECYAKQRKCPAKFLSMIFTNLFPNLDKPLFFKDVQNNNMFEQIEEPLPDGYTTNVLSFYPQIHFWFLRLISNPRAHTIGIIMSEPVDLKVNPINLLDLISEKAKDHIKIKGKDELPYWMQVTNYISNAPLNWYRIDRPYYLKLFRILYDFRYLPISMIKNLILNLPIEQIEVDTSFDEKSKLTNIPIFDRIFPGSTENDHYDLTGFMFSISYPNKLIDFSSGIPQLPLGPNMMGTVNNCTTKIFDEIEKFRKLLGYKEMRTETEDIFIRLKFFLGNLFDAYCAYALNYINARGVYVHKSGHEISVVRSLEKKKWYHVSNTCIAPIENIEDILYAYRDNELWKYQLSKIGNHDHYVNLWEIARGVRS